LKNITIKRYTKTDFNTWNDFVTNAKNATFLHIRSFMDYHSDRFEEYSLIVLENEKWIAVLPANVVENQVLSHQGLTYGGLLYNENLKLGTVIDAFKTILKYLNENNISKLQIKTVPSIYHKKPAEELNYALFLTQSKLIRSDCLSVLELQKDNFITKTRKESIRRGQKNGLLIKEDANFELFWNEILIPNLEQKHQAKPVHSLTEIEKLHQLFPENIRHFNVYFNDKIVAGTTVFVTDNVVHPQYISGQKDKNELGSIDFLYHYLISEVFKNATIFDFGSSHEQNGTKINEGILFWKESFGATIVSHNHFEVETKNHHLLENVLI
jgi:hypothetical protein